MRVTMAMVMSLDGRITSGEVDDTGAWISPKDQVKFAQLKEEHASIIMGSKTFMANRARMQIDPAKPRIVMTRSPARYMSLMQPGLEFTEDGPRSILDDLAARGYPNTLLLGGAAVNAQFLGAGLVDELAITTEPKLFGAGLPLTQAFEGQVDLQLISSEVLNEQGTIFSRYSVVRGE